MSIQFGNENDTFGFPSNLGVDEIRGGGGNDTLDGGLGGDQLFGESGNDKIDGGTGKDKIDGGTGNDTLNGQEGNDTIYGRSGKDRLDGGLGNDKLYGGTGNDTLKGELGDDKLYGEAGDDILDGGEGTDILDGGAGNDVLTGGSLLGLFAETDSLLGGAGNDVLKSAGFGTIKMNGYGGTTGEIDTLNGAITSKDIFILGASNSVLYLGAGHAVINNFTATLNQDEVHLEGRAIDYTLSAENFGVGNSSNDTVLRRNEDVIAVFVDTLSLDLNGGNFVFS